MSLEYDIPWSRAKIIREKYWGGEEKMQYYARTDGKPADIAGKNRETGNLGEAAARIMFQSLGYDSPELSLDTDSMYGEWNDDIKVLQPCYIVTSSGKRYRVKEDISVKAQTAYSANRYGTSWMLQRQTPDRPKDPLLNDPNSHSLIIGVVIHDYKHGENIRASVYPFFWPEIYPNLEHPKKPEYRGKKCVWYLDKTRHLVVPCIEPVFAR